MGIYKNMVNGGAYTCKIVDYKSQCVGDECTLKRGEECGRLLPGQGSDPEPYYFIGDCFTNMWPLNQLV
jgi:hypothetical protein